MAAAEEVSVLAENLMKDAPGTSTAGEEKHLSELPVTGVTRDQC